MPDSTISTAQKPVASPTRLLVILLVALPLLIWARYYRRDWQANQHTLQVRIERIPGKTKDPVASLLFPDLQRQWQGVILDLPFDADNPVNGEIPHTDRETGETLLGPQWKWQRTRTQYRASPSEPWQDRAIEIHGGTEGSPSSDISEKRWPVVPGEWKETIEASFEIYNEAETKTWSGRATHENIVSITPEIYKAYFVAADRKWKKEERERLVDNEKAEQESREFHRWMEAVKHLADIKNVQWRRTAKEAWRALPREGEKDYPLKVRLSQGLWFRVLPNDPTIDVRFEELSWQLGDGGRSEWVRSALDIASSKNINSPSYVAPERPPWRNGTGAREFFVPVEAGDAEGGADIPLKIKWGNEVSTMLRVLPAFPSGPTTATQAAATTLTIMGETSNRPIPIGRTRQILVYASTERGISDLPVWIEARDSRGMPVGQINEPGLADDTADIRFVSRKTGSGVGTTTFIWRPGTRPTKVFLKATLRDKMGRVLKASPPVTVMLLPLTVQVTPKEWQKVGNGFVREIEVQAGMRTKGGGLATESDVPFHLDIETPVGTPPGTTWLDKTDGVTDTKNFRGWTTKQHWKLRPTASLYLDNYRVVGHVKAAEPPKPMATPIPVTKGRIR